MTAPLQALGRWGEAAAADFLARQGYEIIEQNARTPYGELDLVTRDHGVTVFVEVKTRRSRRFGFPEEAVTARKRQRLMEAGQAYLLAHPELDGDWRVDVIAILQDPHERLPRFTHFENVLS
jgi:putative endonuclease